MSATINALRPTQNPATRFGVGDVPFAGPRMGANALQVPAATQPPPTPLVPVQPAVGAIAPGVVPQGAAAPAPPVDTADRISARVPAPTADFHPDQHAELHQAMGPAFDKPAAAQAVREAYDAVRARHPHVDARAVLLSARDAYHAVQHGFIGDHATARQAMLDHPAVLAHPDIRRQP